jgi:DNA-binding response OmpR family regulator
MQESVQFGPERGGVATPTANAAAVTAAVTAATAPVARLIVVRGAGAEPSTSAVGRVWDRAVEDVSAVLIASPDGRVCAWAVAVMVPARPVCGQGLLAHRPAFVTQSGPGERGHATEEMARLGAVGAPTRLRPEPAISFGVSLESGRTLMTPVGRWVDGVRLLIVEDEPGIRRSLREGLEQHGFAVEETASGREAVARAGDVDLVLLDLGLPDVDGKEVCREIRSRLSVPIIVVTARGDEIDRVLLLEMGADDYLVKPFGFRELVARIGAVTRRAVPAGGATPVQMLGPLRVDRDARRVFVDGAEVELTRKEYDLLAMLAERPGAVRTREDIVDQVWDVNWFGPTKTLDVHVASLRRKLGHPEWISTVRGVGYRFESPG